MKKIIKFALVLILIGLVFVGFAWIYYGRSFSFNVRNRISVNDDFYYDDYDYSEDGYNKKHLKLKTSESIDFDDVDSLKIHTEVAGIEISEGSSRNLEYEIYNYKNSDIRVTLKDGVLDIKDKSGRRKFFNFFSWFNVYKEDVNVIKIFVPKNKTFDYIEMNNGVGSVTVNDITTKKFVFKGGVGESFFKNFISDNTNISGGVGEMTFENCLLKDLKLEGGIGEITFDGTLRGNCIIEMGIGEVNVQLKDSANNYNIDSSIGLGAVDIDGREVKRNSRIENSAETTLKIKGGIGDISIAFND